ncbi:hypothetical protein ACEWY4_011388 [Coilia grayii]|uniref:Uncharacterized protein n=1 Tax=Coilia grayii TaxID=363190 RepID=A0ABD1K4L4_9TELE
MCPSPLASRGSYVPLTCCSRGSYPPFARYSRGSYLSASRHSPVEAAMRPSPATVEAAMCPSPVEAAMLPSPVEAAMRPSPVEAAMCPSSVYPGPRGCVCVSYRCILALVDVFASYRCILALVDVFFFISYKCNLAPVDVFACPAGVRCNLAPVDEFAADVGRRTNLVTMNPSVVQRAFRDLSSEEWRRRLVRRLQDLSGSVLWIPAFMAKGGEERVEWVVRLILTHTVNVRTAFPSLRLLHAVRGYWLTNRVQIKRPTTGLLMYTMATRFCDEIHLYGFWPFHRDQQGNRVKYHYYDTLTYEFTSRSSPHTMPLEFRTLSSLHRQGALRLHTASCSSPAA